MSNGNGSNNLRPKVLVGIEHLDHAVGHISAASRVFASVALDLEQRASYMGSYRDSMIKAVEETGGDIGAAVESQIREFVGANQRRVDDDAGPQA
jgi:hypothetical protein